MFSILKEILPHNAFKKEHQSKYRRYTIVDNVQSPFRRLSQLGQDPTGLSFHHGPVQGSDGKLFQACGRIRHQCRCPEQLQADPALHGRCGIAHGMGGQAHFCAPAPEGAADPGDGPHQLETGGEQHQHIDVGGRLQERGLPLDVPHAGQAGELQYAGTHRPGQGFHRLVRPGTYRLPVGGPGVRGRGLDGLSQQGEHQVPYQDKEQFQGVLPEKTKADYGLASVQRPEGGRTKALWANFKDKRPAVLSFRDKDDQGRQSGPSDPGLLQQARPGPGTLSDAMAGGDLVPGNEIQWVQHRGHPCGRPGEAGEIDAAGHDSLCLVL